MDIDIKKFIYFGHEFCIMIISQGILELPALTMFRNGGMIVIYGDNVQVILNISTIY